MRCMASLALLISAACLSPVSHAAPVALTKLTGLTGGAPADTAIFKADLSALGLANILSVTIADSNSGIGGSPGQFSGFDLDGIKLSTTDCADAACAAAAVDAGAFSFTDSQVLFTPGTQRAPADPKLFGTAISGVDVDFGVATFGLFDANATTGPTAAGFLSMGDGGILTFNLTAALASAGLFLYIGEVGDNGETAASNITVQDVTVPEPASLMLLGAGLAGLTQLRRRRNAIAA